MTSHQYAIFCDFDGTVSSRDVGYHVYHHFSGGRTDEFLPDWMAGRMSTRECLRRESEMVSVTPEQFYAFVDTFELTAGFPEFVQRCHAESIPLHLLSDGLDIYIERLLANYGITGLPVICNKGRLANNRIEIDFPYPDPRKTGGGVCKDDRIAAFRDGNKGPVKVVFVGDGLSDVKAIGQSDLLFAKKDLKDYCERRNIPYYAFDTFSDVTTELVAQSVFTA